MDQASSTLCCWRRGLFIRGHFSFRFVQWLMVGTLPALRADPSPPPLPPAPRAPGSGLRPLLPALTQARLSLSPSHRILGGLVCSRLCHPLYQKGCRGTSCPPNHERGCWRPAGSSQSHKSQHGGIQNVPSTAPPGLHTSSGFFGFCE